MFEENKIYKRTRRYTQTNILRSSHRSPSDSLRETDPHRKPAIQHLQPIIMAYSAPSNLNPQQWGKVAEFEERRRGQERRTRRHIRYRHSLTCSPSADTTDNCTCRWRNCRKKCRMANHGHEADELENL